MLEVQHLELDQDRYVNEMIEEAATDLLKKCRTKKQGHSTLLGRVGLCVEERNRDLLHLLVA